jgi:hypothetical protein
VSLEETSKIKHLKKLWITKENHRNQVIPVIFGGDYWTRTSGLMRVKHKAAEHLVKHAKGLLSQLDYFPKDGDQLWCVFDCDDNKNSELKNAADYAEKHGYKIAYSNPCFEFWYLLHFVKQNSYLNGAEEVLHQLQSKGRLEKYEKNLDVFADLLPHQSEAIRRARERLDSLYKDNVVILSRDSNPVTTVCELVEYLNSQQS